MLNGIAGTWWRWSERAEGPQHRLALPSYVTCTGQEEFGERPWGLQAGSSTGSKVWPGMEYPTVLNALILIQQPSEVRKCYFSHFPGEGQRCSCSGSHPMTHLISHCAFRRLNSHLNQAGTAFHHVGWHQQCVAKCFPK